MNFNDDEEDYEDGDDHGYIEDIDVNIRVATVVSVDEDMAPHSRVPSSINPEASTFDTSLEDA